MANPGFPGGPPAPEPGRGGGVETAAPKILYNSAPMGSFKEILIAGGPVLAGLIVLSIYTLAVIFERFARYRRLFGDLPGFLAKVADSAERGNLNQVLSLSKAQENPAAAVFAKTLGVAGTASDRREILHSEAAYQMTLFQSGIGQLATIGSIAPFIGLLGTVIGVMKAFKNLGGSGAAGANVVAVGISEALICTAAGLAVAIPAIVAFNWFTNRLNRHHQDITRLAEELLEKAPRR